MRYLITNCTQSILGIGNNLLGPGKKREFTVDAFSNPAYREGLNKLIQKKMVLCHHVSEGEDKNGILSQPAPETLSKRQKRQQEKEQKAAEDSAETAEPTPPKKVTKKRRRRTKKASKKAKVQIEVKEEVEALESVEAKEEPLVEEVSKKTLPIAFADEEDFDDFDEA